MWMFIKKKKNWSKAPSTLLELTSDVNKDTFIRINLNSLQDPAYYTLKSWTKHNFFSGHNQQLWHWLTLFPLMQRKQRMQLRVDRVINNDLLTCLNKPNQTGPLALMIHTLGVGVLFLLWASFLALGSEVFEDLRLTHEVCVFWDLIPGEKVELKPF